MMILSLPRHFRLFLVFAWLPAIPIGSSVHAEPPPFGATLTGQFAEVGEPAMIMPTDVAVSKDGRVFVADGVNQRVVVFSPDGRLIENVHKVGDQMLSNPTGLAVDGQGRLFISDAGLHTVLVRGADGRLVQTLVLQARADERRPDPTDVAVEPDGSAAWVVDNENHRLLRFDLQTGAQTMMGSYGESVGQLHHPFMIALGREGDAFVTDVINSRVAVFIRNAAPSQPVGSYGIDLGQLYRPKGVACDSASDVWVSDSVLGVVQVFSSDGAPRDVLRGADAKVFRFSTPMGMAFDANGRLYVTELSANRVVQVTITRGPPAPPREARHARIVGGQARSCTVCHVEWIEPFSHGQATAIAEPPPSTAEEPAVSRSEMCLSCHDGAVIDSRVRVWLEHGHRTGVTPPPDMTVPRQLPLVNGKIACRTCHSAHTTGKFDSDFRAAVFLRVQNVASELCVSCHKDKTRGPQFGTHPIGGMPWPIPRALVAAGAKVGPNPRELTCQVCHTPHGSREDHLLVMGTSSNQLCLNCHDQMRPGMFREGGATEHPLSPHVNAGQAAAVVTMGTKLGPEDKLICLSCHKLHHGKGGRFMLAEDLADGRFCTQCHSEKKQLFGSLHDLRIHHPDEKNRLGMTPQSGGPCSACHMFHRYARSPEPSELDPGGGKCITCHQTGRCAASKVLASANHPGAHCVDCHNPHDPTRKNFVRADLKDACAKCHPSQTALVGGPHDYRKTGESWPAEATAMQDTCFACHRPHGDDATGLNRIAGAAGGNDAGCRVCHPTYVWGADGSLAALHPNEMKAGMSHGDLPLVSVKGCDTGSVGCRTCHDPHIAVAGNPSMLRAGPDRTPISLCTTCHTEAAALVLTSHNTTGLSKAGFKDAAMCAPCHVMHGDSAAVDPHRLWRKSLSSAGAEIRAAEAYCTSCHRDGGPAKRPVIATHPDVVTQAVAAAQLNRSLPLFDQDGRENPGGQITCGTCHVPHGQIMSKEEEAYLAALLPSEQKAARLMLRPFRPPNLCTACHGADALRRFLYFHDPERRTGPLGTGEARTGFTR